MSKSTQLDGSARKSLLLVLLVAAALRFIGLAWDQGHAFHPDERRIAFALGDLSFRPLQLNPHFFAYGSFPIYLQKIWASFAGWIHPAWNGFHGSILAARGLSALIGVAMVALVWALGRRLYGQSTAVLAALFLALAVLPIQNAHFITVDLYQAALVLLVLERLVTFVEEGPRTPYWVAAIATGFALATKVSSAPLFLPLVLAPLLCPSRDGSPLRLRSRFGLAFFGVVLAALAFVAGEPYALIDRAAFLHDLREQSQMVRQAGTVPYTIQYLGTVPYVSDLWQVVAWGLGPSLGVAALAGTLAALARIWRRPTVGEILVLSIFVPYLLITGWFPVKFMRYLLPLYPIWCLYAARLLRGDDERPRRLRRIVGAIVVGTTTVYALAFASIYTRPHIWVTASRWFYREIPATSIVLTPHWEEGFPVPVDGFEPGRYRSLELPLYESDGDKKINLLAARLAEGDVLVFPSKRLYGAISNAPARYPQTSRLIDLLFAGDLGYRLDRVFASRPALFGFELDDDFADESFSVYDHPKTLVFRKIESLPASEIVTRIRSRVPTRPIVRDDLLGASTTKLPALEETGSSWIESSLLAPLLWLGALSALSFAGRRILHAALPGLPVAAVVGLGPTLGYLLFLYLSWLIAALGWARFDGFETLGVAVALWLTALRLPAARSALGSGIFYAAFLFYLAIRALNPEIYWGEKPMDFSFLNALYRATTIPPPEPWMSGTTINYSYLGHFGIAALGKLTAVAPSLAFNLGIATIGGLAASAAFGAAMLLTGRRVGGVVAALLVAFAGNLSGPLELRRHGATANFDYFWATSRVIANTINEFPLWSLLFADLHAHVMALPLALLFLGLVCAWFMRLEARGFSVVLLASLTLGSIATTNSWSLLVYAAALGGAALLAAIRERRPTRLVFVPLVIGVSYLWFWSYWSRFVVPPRNWGWESESAPLAGVLLIFGGFLFVVVGALEAVGRRARWHWSLRALTIAILVISAWHAPRYGFLLLGAACIVAALLEGKPQPAFAFALAAIAALLGALTDTVYLWDRMNTVFKIYLEMWLFFALASAYWLSSPAIAPTAAFGRWSHRLVLAALAAVTAVTAVTDVMATVRTVRVPGPRPTLDGVAYLRGYNPLDALAIRWLNRQIADSPVLLEAQGPSYQDFSRISMNTGLPTVLGWDYHLSQRAHPWSEINQRKAAVRDLFTSEDRPRVERLLATYRVAIVYVGALERRTYAQGLDKFDAWKDLFQPIYRNRGVAIYAVPTNFRWSEAAPVIESVSGADAPEDAQEPLPPGELRQPRGVAVDRHGDVWVADFGNNRVQAFGASLEPLRSFGQRGDEAGNFRDPCGVAIGPDGRIYVADTWNQRVEVFDPDGHLVRQWTGDFYGPRGIAVASDGTVYVADTGNGQIAVFDAEGVPLSRFGKKGSGTGDLDEPVGIAIDRDGLLYVADAGNRRIVVLDREGAQRAAWPVPGWKPQVLREPYVAVLDDGRVVATDPTADRLLFYDRQGNIVGGVALAPGSNPTGVAQLADGRLVVANLKLDQIAIVNIP